MNLIPYFYILICGVLAMILCFSFLGNLEKSSFSQTFQYGFKNLLTFPKWVRKENNLPLRLRMQVLYWAQLILVPLYFLGFYLLISIQ